MVYGLGFRPTQGILDEHAHGAVRVVGNAQQRRKVRVPPQLDKHFDLARELLAVTERAPQLEQRHRYGRLPDACTTQGYKGEKLHTGRSLQVGPCVVIFTHIAAFVHVTAGYSAVT